MIGVIHFEVIAIDIVFTCSEAGFHIYSSIWLCYVIITISFYFISRVYTSLLHYTFSPRRFFPAIYLKIREGENNTMSICQPISLSAFEFLHSWMTPEEKDRLKMNHLE